MTETNKLTDQVLSEFEKKYSLFTIYIHFFNGFILKYPIECYYEECEQPFGCGVFISSDELDNIYLSDPNLHKITDKTGKHVLWQRSDSDKLNPKYDTADRVTLEDWEILEFPSPDPKFYK